MSDEPLMCPLLTSAKAAKTGYVLSNTITPCREERCAFWNINKLRCGLIHD